MMIRILIVCGALRIGGAEKIACELGMRSDPDKMKIDYVVFGEQEGEYEPDLLKHGCRIFHMPSPGENHRRFVKNMHDIIRKNQYHVVHCHTMFNSGLVLGVAKMEGVPVRIAHSHTIRAARHMGFVKEIYQAVMRKLIQITATDYVACGKEAGEWLFGKEFFEKHGTLILNGIDVREFAFSQENRDLIRNKHDLNDSFVIGHAGHMFPVKNQIYLIRLMPEILRVKVNAKLLLLGDGADREKLQNEIHKLNLKNHVIMPGNVMNVNQYLSAMDVFAFPSLYEGMPLSMIEVQANGLPCIISDTVPHDVYLTDLLKKTSLDDTDLWVQRLCSAVRNNSASYNGIMHNTGFDTSAMVEKVYKIYEKDTVHH